METSLNIFKTSGLAFSFYPLRNEKIKASECLKCLLLKSYSKSFWGSAHYFEQHALGLRPSRYPGEGVLEWGLEKTI
jgi:hypothetical protein